MDIQMPGKDGLQTTVVVRTELGITDTPIIAMTANALDEDRERCLQSGMDDFITKPIKPERLFDVLDFHLGQAVPWLRRVGLWTRSLH